MYLNRGDDPSWMAKVYADYDAICNSLGDPNAGISITSATVNGQTFMASNSGGRTAKETEMILSLIISMDRAGRAPISESHAYFP